MRWPRPTSTRSSYSSIRIGFVWLFSACAFAFMRTYKLLTFFRSGQSFSPNCGGHNWHLLRFDPYFGQGAGALLFRHNSLGASGPRISDSGFEYLAGDVCWRRVSLARGESLHTPHTHPWYLRQALHNGTLLQFVPFARAYMCYGKSKVHFLTGSEGPEEEKRYSSTISLTSVINTTPRPLYSRQWSFTHCVGGWVGTRIRLVGCGKSRLHRDSFTELSIS